MRWIKKGLLFEPSGNLECMVTHAMLPVPHYIGDDIYRIYFAGRDSQNRSQGCYMEFSINAPSDILYLTEKPILKLGPIGSFDDSGVIPSWIVDYNGKKYMYYIGWMLGRTVPFYAAIGLAISRDGGEIFEKYSQAPILARNDNDPFMMSSPCVMIDEGIWKLWYLSCVKWVVVDGEPKHFYNIRYTESEDGINWDSKGVVCIDFKSETEYAISRPCVVKEQGLYKMWYSYRGESYRIGYAESTDGKSWQRKDDEVGIDVSEEGWDSEMICYAYIFRHKGRHYMLYNGNGYGKTGIGYAVLE